MKFLCYNGRFIPLSETFSVEDIIGATLFAKKPVNLVRLPADDAPVIYTVPVGDQIGVVYSWLNIKPGRTAIYLAFYDADNRAYYARVEEGAFDLKSLQVQTNAWNEPIKSEEQKREDEARANMAWYEKVLDDLKTPAMWVGGFILLNSLIRSQSPK